jgi:hypothetical protein
VLKLDATNIIKYKFGVKFPKKIKHVKQIIQGKRGTPCHMKPENLETNKK